MKRKNCGLVGIAVLALAVVFSLAPNVRAQRRGWDGGGRWGGGWGGRYDRWGGNGWGYPYSYDNYSWGSPYYGNSGSGNYSFENYPPEDSYSSGGPYTNYQSFYAAGQNQADQNVAQIDVRVPTDAQVFFDGQKTNQRGVLRRFISPALEPDQNYGYDIQAKWKDQNGKEITRTKHVSVHAGTHVMVAFGDMMGQGGKSRTSNEERRMPSDEKRMPSDEKVTPVEPPAGRSATDNLPPAGSSTGSPTEGGSATKTPK